MLGLQPIWVLCDDGILHNTAYFFRHESDISKLWSVSHGSPQSPRSVGCRGVAVVDDRLHSLPFLVLSVHVIVLWIEKHSGSGQLHLGPDGPGYVEALQIGRVHCIGCSSQCPLTVK